MPSNKSREQGDVFGEDRRPQSRHCYLEVSRTRVAGLCAKDPLRRRDAGLPLGSQILDSLAEPIDQAETNARVRTRIDSK
jgi:hypothetical protein